MNKMRASIGFGWLDQNGQIRQLMLCVQLLAVCLVPSVTQGQAVITGITVSASPAIAGRPVTITVQGTGTCRVTLYIDEAMQGIPYVNLTDGDLPKSIEHAYQRPGLFHLNATPQYGYKSCAGNVRLDLRVVAEGVGGGGRGSDTCQPGFVWRESRISDHVCVSPQTRYRTRAENYAGGRTTVSGSDVCKQGYVWREAFPTDHVCVTPQSRAAVADDNRHAAERQVR